MANIVWAGSRSTTAQVNTYTVTAVASGGTLTLTVGNRKSVSYSCNGSDTTTTAATALFNLLTTAQASEREWSELTLANPANGVITLTGPADGAPVTLSKTDAGGATSTLSLTTAPTSPSDVGDAVNWAGGVLPGNTDTMVFENTSVDAKYNLAALAAVTCGLIRRSTYTGRIGLPDQNPAGYAEYRPTYLQFAGTSASVATAPSDSAAQVRLQFTGAAATVTVTGSGAAAWPGSESVELTGLAASSVVNIAASSVAMCPLTGQTGTVTTLRATDATVRVGPGCTLASANLTNTNGLILCSYTALEMDRGGTVTVSGSGSGTTTTLDGGTLAWQSTGGPGTATVGSDAVLDLSEAPAAVALAGNLSVSEGGTLTDPSGKLIAAGSYTIVLQRTQLDRVTLDLGTGRTITVAT